MSYTNLLYHIV